MQMFQVLAENSLVLNCDMCVISRMTIYFLGHTVSKNGITPLVDRVDCIFWIWAKFSRGTSKVPGSHQFLPPVHSSCCWDASSFTCCSLQPSLEAQIGTWADYCLPECQASTQWCLATSPSECQGNYCCYLQCFGHTRWHLPWPSLCGYRRPPPTLSWLTYIFTDIESLNYWTKTIPMMNSIAPKFTRGLSHEWISKFGVPDEMTSDCNPQFTSDLWDQLHHILGMKAYRTTSYHPQANGMVERFHCTMKDFLMASLGNNPNWMEELPAVMLGLHTVFKEDFSCSSA